MKTIKFILAALLMMVAFTVQAQTVQVYKNGVVVKEYPASEVASVEVKQVYYYYLGSWRDKPTTVDELIAINTTYSERPTSLTLPADTDVAQAFIYPAEWGQAKFLDDVFNSNFGTVKPSPFPGYNMTQISAAQADGFGTCPITWKTSW